MPIGHKTKHVLVAITVTLSIMTLRVTTLSLVTISIIVHSIAELIVMALSITTQPNGSQD